MIIDNWIYIATVSISILLVLCILMQAQGTGFGTTWSGGGETFHTRRGIEKVVFNLTIFLIVAFVALAVTSLIIR